MEAIQTSPEPSIGALVGSVSKSLVAPARERCLRRKWRGVLLQQRLNAFAPPGMGTRRVVDSRLALPGRLIQCEWTGR